MTTTITSYHQAMSPLITSKPTVAWHADRMPFKVEPLDKVQNQLFSKCQRFLSAAGIQMIKKPAQRQRDKSWVMACSCWLRSLAVHSLFELQSETDLRPVLVSGFHKQRSEVLSLGVWMWLKRLWNDWCSPALIDALPLQEVSLNCVSYRNNVRSILIGTLEKKG